MGNYAISLIRTWVPVAVGALASYLLVHFGLDISAGSQAAVIPPLTGGCIAVYYAGVRWVEMKWPAAGVLLGHTAKPVYHHPAVVHTPHTHIATRGSAHVRH
jgi:hypothetical protein